MVRYGLIVVSVGAGLAMASAQTAPDCTDPAVGEGAVCSGLAAAPLSKATGGAMPVRAAPPSAASLMMGGVLATGQSGGRAASTGATTGTFSTTSTN